MNDVFEDLETEEEREDSEEVTCLDGNVITKQSDPEIDSLYKKYKRGKLILQPSFQRGFVWDAAKSSKLIESALLDIPIPMIYLSEEDDNKEVVIDGQQRLIAFFSFIDGYFVDGKPFKLVGLKKYGNIVGKQFSQLSENYQDKIIYSQVRTITIKRESSENLKFEIFERLNTASVGLNHQELRNCIFRGKYNKLLVELSKNKEYQKMLGLDSPHKRMQDIELVLRFAAFFHVSFLGYRAPMKQFLNKDMEKYRDISDSDAKELEKVFKQSISLVKSVFGDKSFKRYYIGNKNKPAHWEKKSSFNKALFDVLMFSFSKVEKREVYKKLDSIREALIHLMSTDDDFIEAIAYYTNNPSKVKVRFEKWQKIFDEIIGEKSNTPRCFSYTLKEELFKKEPICLICNQKILDIDDAHIDHVVQYWKGGETIPENARLAHRFCNQSRPLKD